MGQRAVSWEERTLQFVSLPHSHALCRPMCVLWLQDSIFQMAGAGPSPGELGSVPSYIYICTYIYTYIHTHVHTYVHTYILTYVHASSLCTLVAAPGALTLYRPLQAPLVSLSHLYHQYRDFPGAWRQLG